MITKDRHKKRYLKTVGRVLNFKNRQCLDALSESVTPLLVSVSEGVFADEAKDSITDAFERIGKGKNVSKSDWLKA